jgi:glycosyltransferase involved in cell wall biosynthesis
MRVLWFLDSEPPMVRQRLGKTGLNEASWHGGLAEALSRSGAVELVVGCHASEPFAPFNAEGVHYHEIGADHARTGAERVVERWRGLRSPSVDLEKCRALVHETRPAVVHVHGTESALGLLAQHSEAPVITSIQGLLTICRIMDSRGLDRYLLRSLSPALFLRGSGYVFQRLELRSWSARERRILAAAHNVIGRTRFDADVVRVLSPAARYHHCDEVLRPEFWDCAWQPCDAVPGRVFTTVRGYARKGIGTLLEALALLRDAARRDPTAPDALPHLHVAGGFVTSEGERAVRRAIHALGLEDCVTLLGTLDALRVAGELTRAAVFALPSHIDNSPNSLAEAMLVGVPCVASAVGGVPSLARDGAEALLVQDGDPFALAGAMGRLLTDAELAARLSRAARQLARRRHDPEAICGRMLEIYQRVAAAGTHLP